MTPIKIPNVFGVSSRGTKKVTDCLFVIDVYCKEFFVFYLIGEAMIYGFQIKA